MEFIKKNIHMERETCRTETQITMEEDVNIRDQAPDAFRIVTQDGKTILEEIHPFTDYITVKGKMQYTILYLGEEDEIRPYCMDGTIAFEEKVHLPGVVPNDTVNIQSKIEDISVSLINSRKLSIRALITWLLSVDVLYDEEIITDVNTEDILEIRREPMEITSLCTSTKDILRVKDEFEIPSGFPNIFQILWKDVNLYGMEYRLMDNMISVHGEINCFVMYEGEGENRPIQCYEVTRPFSQNMELDGCREDFIPDIVFGIEQQTVEVRPDFDGEERVIGLDVTLNVSVKLMDTKELQAITDVYGITVDADPILKESSCHHIQQRSTAKMRLEQKLITKEGDADILQLCHTKADLYQEEERPSKQGLELSGVVTVKSIYLTASSEVPYGSISGHIPYHYLIDIPEMKEQNSYCVRASIQQLSADITGGSEIEIKIIVAFEVLIWEKEDAPMVTDIVIQEADTGKRSRMPGMVLYFMEKDDTIWDIGKKYCVPIRTIYEMNQTTQEEIKPGDKLLLVKEM